MTDDLVTQIKEREKARWIEAMIADAWMEAQRLTRASRQAQSFENYQEDPIGFTEQVLHESLTDDQKKVMLSVRDNMVTIAKSATEVGKSFAAARLAIWFYKVFPDSQIYLTAAPPVENLKRILWGEVMSCVDKNASLFLDDRIKVDYILRNPTSFITRVTVPTTGTSEIREAKFSGKHAPHILFIVDEGDAVPDEVYKGIEGCLSGGLMPRLLVMFNPRIMQGAVFEKEVNHQANVINLSALSHPNVVTGQSIIPGAVMRDSVIRRFNEWTRPLMPNELVNESCVDVPEYLVGKVAWGQDGNMFPPLEAGTRVVKEDGKAFFYMVLGKYPPQGESQLISQDWIDKARKRWDEYVLHNGEVPPDTKPLMGMDVAEMGGDWNVVCLRYNGFVSRLSECWQGMDSYQSAMRALDIYRKFHVDIALIDGMGIGGSIAPTMVRAGREKGLLKNENWDIRAVSVKVSEKPLNFIKTELGEFKIMRDQLWWACREWLRTDESAMLPPDRMLLEELMSVSYNIPQDGRIRVTDKETLRDKLKRSPDRADALCLTFYPVRRARTIVYNRKL